MTADLFTPSESPTQPSPEQSGPGEVRDAGRWLDRPGPNGTTVKWWMPTLRPGGRRWFKQTGKTALERAEAKRQAQAEEDSRREKTAKEGKTA